MVKAGLREFKAKALIVKNSGIAALDDCECPWFIMLNVLSLILIVSTFDTLSNMQCIFVHNTF